MLPVCDLAVQVHQVFEDCAKGTSLKIGLAVGQKSFEEEVKSLIERKPDGNHRSTVDILVVTPGHLVTLIHKAEGFNLTKLEIIIVDEADRLTETDMQQNWFEEVEKSVHESSKKNDVSCVCQLENLDQNKTFSLSCLCPCSLSSYSSETRSIQKILFSATLSTEPEKLQKLNLFLPKLFLATSTESVTPTGLSEKMIIIKSDLKPLAVWYMIASLGYRKILCFTGSIENTHRLYLLLNQLPNIQVAELSSQLKCKTREKLVKQFNENKIDVIVCSDMMARGIDLDGAQYVICYDPPTSRTAYIHRVGRTARAGKKGTAITLVTSEQLGFFQVIIRKVHRKRSKKEQIIEKITFRKSQLKPYIEPYKEALNNLKKLLKSKKSFN